MLKKRYFLLALVALMCFALLAGCGGGEQPTDGTEQPSGGTETKEDIIIGWVAPLTGNAANQGEQLMEGAKLAVDQINAAGGIDGRMVKLDPQDDKSDPKEAASIANKFSADSKIVAVIGNYNSSCALAGFPIYNETGLTMITSGTSPVITEQHGEFGWRIAVTDAFQGKFVTDWLFKDGFKKPAILYENNDYGLGLKDVVVAEIEAQGSAPAIIETYMMGETKDFTGILTKVKATDADTLFIAGLYNEGALIAKQAKQLGITLPIYSNEALFEQIYIDLAGDAAEGTKVCGLLVPTDTDPVVQKFLQDCQAAYGKTAGTFTAFGYDTAMVIINAIKAVGTDRTAINEYLKTMPLYEGASGKIVFDEEHDAVRETLKKLIVKDAAFSLVE